jgi:nucleotide-binding universal stress UspA family protein
LLLHVIEPPKHTRIILNPSKVLEDRRSQVAETLAQLEEQTKQRHDSCRSEVHTGIPYKVIADVAKKAEVDLIIMMTHGHAGLYHLFPGSVAERVVRLSPCPILMVRAFEAPIPQRNVSTDVRHSHLAI